MLPLQNFAIDMLALQTSSLLHVTFPRLCIDMFYRYYLSKAIEDFPLLCPTVSSTEAASLDTVEF